MAKNIKKYGKKTTILFQVRLSKKEYSKVIERIKDLGITRRVWILNKLIINNNAKL